MVESREPVIWMVQTELLSHFFFQLFYHLLLPFHWDGLSVINLVSCLAGAIAVYVLLLFNERFIRIDPLWVLGLFFSSGFALYCNGHTEYYTLFLITMFYYGLVGVGYLRGENSMLHVSLAFALALWMHLGILFALPSLLLLPLLTKRPKDYLPLFQGQLLSLFAYFTKRHAYIFGIHVQGLSPSDNFIPLFEDPSGERFYLMFEWWHLIDLIYAWVMRSWIFWPVILWAIGLYGFKSLRRPDRMFLLLYTLGFTFFTLVWHPNLGMHQDWDLWAIEAAPCLLLLLTYMPDFLRSPYRKTVLLLPVIASMLIMASHIWDEAQFHRRGYGSVVIKPTQEIDCGVTLNGHKKNPTMPSVREGIHTVKFFNNNHFRIHDFYVFVAPEVTTEITLQVGKNYGHGKSSTEP